MEFSSKSREPRRRRQQSSLVFDLRQAEAPALPGGSYESETGVIQARCQFLSNPLLFQSLEPVLRHANPDLFQASPAPAPHDGADHSRVKQLEIDNPFVTLVSRCG